MPAPEEAYGEGHLATFNQEQKVKTEFRETAPGSGQYGYMAVEDEVPVIRIPRPNGTIRAIRPTPTRGVPHHGDFSGEAFGDDQPGFDTIETPVVSHDCGPDA